MPIPKLPMYGRKLMDTPINKLPKQKIADLYNIASYTTSKSNNPPINGHTVGMHNLGCFDNTGHLNDMGKAAFDKTYKKLGINSSTRAGDFVSQLIEWLSIHDNKVPRLDRFI